MGLIPKRTNSRKRKAKERLAFLTRITAAVMAFILIAVPVETSATEEHGMPSEKTFPTFDNLPQEPESLEETESETSMKEETEPETSMKEETEPETSVKEETEPASDTAPRESESGKKTEGTEPETSAKEETEPTSAGIPKETEEPKRTETETSSREQEEKVSGEKVSESGKGTRSKMPDAVEIMIPIYNYDVVNIVAPARYAVALNPYELAVKTGQDEVSTDQVVSRKYGILNKSSTDKIVSITLEVEDLNGGEIVFVDSPEEVWEADENTYAVYLAAVPADGSGIWIGGEPADCDTTAMDLSDVEMNEAMESALPLREGENTISFKLSKAVYNFEDGSELVLDEEKSEGKGSLMLSGLDPGEGGITAFTFTGVMNSKADWGKLLYGIRISAIYTYENATGEEIIADGTGAMLEMSSN